MMNSLETKLIRYRTKENSEYICIYQQHEVLDRQTSVLAITLIALMCNQTSHEILISDERV